MLVAWLACSLLVQVAPRTRVSAAIVPGDRAHDVVVQLHDRHDPHVRRTVVVPGDREHERLACAA